VYRGTYDGQDVAGILRNDLALLLQNAWYC
jgi:hypothetical protein